MDEGLLEAAAEQSSSPSPTQQLKAGIVNELTRLISGTLTQDMKSLAGTERLAGRLPYQCISEQTLQLRRQ